MDLVYVASPPASHLDWARGTLTAGKALWLEKPFAADRAGAKEFIATLQGGAFPNPRAWMHFPLATLPGMARMRRDLAGDDFGALQRVEIVLQFSQWPRTWHHAGPWLAGAEEGGFCREVLSHFVYLTQTLLGPLQPLWRDVERGPSGTETQVFASWEADGVPVSLTAGVAAGAPDHNRWTLFGERQSVRVEDWSHVTWGNAQGWSEHRLEPGEGPGIATSLDALHAALTGNGTAQIPELPSLLEGFDVMTTVERLLDPVELA